MFTGSWANNEAGQLGLANNGSSSSDTTGVWSSWVKGNSSSQATDTGLGAIFTSSTNWDNIGAVSLVYSFSTPETGATTVNTAITIAYLDGTAATTTGETKSNIVFSGVSGFAATGIEVNETYVKNYEVSSIYTTLNDAKAMSAALVPEPTTATLSLLALAGLAARRRRH
ncbi:MAG: PEP-CTERM sorting domain-containing protein [Akkermansia sp.]|nr:PEP-CTERM sorting domain-containing protein [Akkermansia sp.]